MLTEESFTVLEISMDLGGTVFSLARNPPTMSKHHKILKKKKNPINTPGEGVLELLRETWSLRVRETFSALVPAESQQGPEPGHRAPEEEDV